MSLSSRVCKYSRFDCLVVSFCTHLRRLKIRFYRNDRNILRIPCSVKLLSNPHWIWVNIKYANIQQHFIRRQNKSERKLKTKKLLASVIGERKWNEKRKSKIAKNTKFPYAYAFFVQHSQFDFGRNQNSKFIDEQ